MVLEFKSIIENGMIVLSNAQALDFMVQMIKIFINKLRSASLTKNTIDDFNDNLWFTKLKNVNVDRSIIRELLKDFNKPTDIKKFKLSLKQYFSQLAGNDKDVNLLVELFLTSMYDSINDNEKASFALLIDSIDDNTKMLKTILQMTESIKSAEEMEKELRNNLREDAEITDFDIRYFFIDDINFKNEFDDFLNNGKEISVKTYSIEEGIYCILNYLKYERKIENIYVINDEKTWNNLNENHIENVILIANFFAENNFKKYKKAKQIFIYNKQTQISTAESVELRKRTIQNLQDVLIKQYSFKYDKAKKFLEQTNGNYYLVKKRLYTSVEKKYDEYIDKNKFVALLLVNRFSNNEYSKKYIKDIFSLDFDKIIEDIQNSDLFRNNFKIINRYGNKSVSVLDAISLWGKYDLFNDDKVKEEIERICQIISLKFELKDCGIYLGFICSLTIYRLLNYFSSNCILDKFANDILLKVKEENDWGYLMSILPYLIEIAPDLIVRRFLEEFNNTKDTGLANVFKEKRDYNLYIKYLWIIEKSLYLVDDKKLPVEVLFAILQKKFDYKMNNPADILRKLIFPGIESPLKFEQTKQIFNTLINEYSEVDVWDIFYNNVNNGIAFSWSKPEIADYNDEYVNDIKKTYMYCFNKLLDLPKNNKKIIEIIQLIYRNYNSISGFEKQIDEMLDKTINSDDLSKFYIKYNLLELLYNYRYFDNDGVWKTDKNSLKFIENQIKKIGFSDINYDHLFVFQNENRYNLIVPFKHNTDNDFDKNIQQAKKYKKEYFSKHCVDIEKVIICYKKLINEKYDDIAQYAFQISSDIAIYFDNAIFDIKTFRLLLNYFIEDNLFHKEIFDYIWAINDKGIIKTIIKEYKNHKIKNEDFYIKLLNTLYRISSDISFLEEEDEEIINKFWGNFDYCFFDNSDLMYMVLDKLHLYKNYSCYINTIYHNKNKFDTEKLIILLNKISNLEDSNDSYFLSDILDDLYKNNLNSIKDNIENIISLSNIELKILDKFHYCTYKFTQFLHQNHPDKYADFVFFNDFRLDEGNQKKLVERVLRYNGFRYRLNLNKLNAEEFVKWDKDFKLKLKQNLNNDEKCNEIYYENLGSIIGLSENDKDGAFPLKHFRQYIEDNSGNNVLCDSIVRTKYSKRGMYTPMQGEYNYDVASFFNSCIEKCNGYPFTIKVLKRIREQFLADAKAERELSENENF